MAMFSGKVLMGKYSGLHIDCPKLRPGVVKIGLTEVGEEIKHVTLLNNTVKADLFFSLKPIKNYYQIKIEWYSGEESIVEIDNWGLQMINMNAEVNAEIDAELEAEEND